jgi:maltose O-acetyltransferase
MSRNIPGLRVAKSLRVDGRQMRRQFTRNTLAGSLFMPRVLRAVIFRALGYHFHTANIAAGVQMSNVNVSIDRNARISQGCFFEGHGQISIGVGCLIGHEVAFITSSHSVSAAGEINRQPDPLPITVGAGSWLGARVTVLGGTQIGEGVVVTSGSVVSGICDSGFVYSGVPARKVGRVKALARPS